MVVPTQEEHIPWGQLDKPITVKLTDTSGVEHFFSVQSLDELSAKIQLSDCMFDLTRLDSPLVTQGQERKG